MDPHNHVTCLNMDKILFRKRWERTFGDEELDELAKKQAIMGIGLGILEGEESTIHVGDPVYVAVL